MWALSLFCKKNSHSLGVLCRSLAKADYTFATHLSLYDMKEFFISLKDSVERAVAFWILNNMDLIHGYLKVKYRILAYLKMGVFCLTLPYHFVRFFIQSYKARMRQMAK